MTDQKEIAFGAVRKQWWPAATAMVMVLLTGSLAAQLLVSPTTVFLSDKSPTGRLILLNQSPHDQEISVAFAFGIPESDSLGNVVVNFQDSAVTDPQSALAWIKAFPRSVIIKPGDRQVVRVMAKAPIDLEHGEYWARVMISSQRTDTPLQTLGKAGQIGTRLHMVTRQGIMLKYRVGDLSTHLNLESATASIKDSTVELMLDMTVQGNASYVGTLQCRLTDRDGTEVDTYQLRMAVYRSLRRRIELSLASHAYNPPYQVDLEISNEGRFDINPRDLIKGNTVTYSMTVE